jgi:hypothetical protein
MVPQREWVVRKHKAHFEEPDLLIVKMNGSTDLEDAKGLTEIYRELGTQQPFFVIVDVTNSLTDSEARGYFAKHIDLAWFRAILFVGTGMVEKALGKAMMAAFSFTGRSKTEFMFPATLEEARALLDKLRAKQAAP